LAIVNITRLQVRRGDRADLPQLASAELGWAIDTQQLFIGNGALAEGAPYIGNTEILTEHSNLLENFGSFKYQSNGTGVTISNTVTRTIQSKLDDTASVLDWGANGNGVECSAAINAALATMYGSGGNQQTQISLYFPAGVYLINSPILLPPNTYIFGDGMGNTIIQRGGVGPVVITVDSLGQYGLDMGLGLNISQGQSLPNNITIKDMTFQHVNDQNLTQFQSTTNMTLERVEFLGVNRSDQFVLSTIPYNTQVALSFTGPSNVVESGNIILNQCRFRDLGIGFYQQAPLSGISFNQCLFDFMYQGMIIDDSYAATASISGTTMLVTAVSSGIPSVGASVAGTYVTPGTVITGILNVNLDGTGSYVVNLSQTANSGPVTGSNGEISTVSINNSYFSRISHSAITSLGTASFHSLGNRFINVGNRGGNTPIDSEIIASGPGCVSWMDISDRPESSTIDRFSANSLAVRTRAVIDPQDRFSWGLTEDLIPYKYTLDPTVSTTGTLPELAFYVGNNTYGTPVKNVNTAFQLINYMIKRDGNTRSGTITITADLTPELSFTENSNLSGSADVGVTFSGAIDANGLVTISYSITAGSQATLVARAINFVDE